MTGVLSPSPYLQTTTNNGALNALGTLATYQAGTSIPQATYTDATLTQQNPNPLTFNALGQATVWINPLLAYKYIWFDQFGNQCGSEDNINSSALSVVPSYPISLAEIAAGVTPVNFTYYYGYLQRYGGAGNGLTDNVAALKAAIAQAGAGGANPFAGVGTWNLNSALFPIILPSNIEIDGAGEGVSIFQVTGTGPLYIFVSTDQSNIFFTNATYRGNSRSATAYADGGFWLNQMDGLATATCEKYQCQNIRLENFGGSYWIWNLNQSTNQIMRNGRYISCNFQSFPGNSRNPALIGEAAACISNQGSLTNTAAQVTDFIAEDCWADGTYIKEFFIAWHGTTRCGTLKNRLQNFGQVGSLSNTAGYALLAYDNSSGVSPPQDVFFYDDDITNPLSCGIYMASVASAKIRPGVIRGQSDTANATLPKGAIAINGCGDVSIVGGGQLNNNYIGISLVPTNGTLSTSPNPSRYLVDDVIIDSSIAAAVGIIISPDASTGNSSTVKIAPSVVVHTTDSASFAVLVSMPVASQSMLALEIAGTTIDSPIGIFGSFGGLSPNILQTTIKANKLRNGVTYGITWAGASTGVIAISANEFLGGWGTAAIMCYVVGSKIALHDNIACNMTAGTGMAFFTSTATGTMANNRFYNVSPVYRVSGSSNDMGRVLPSWTGTQGDFVQDCFPTELGVTNSKYTRQGWVYSATWLEVRALDGN